VINEPGGEPKVILHNVAQAICEEKGINRILITISHTSTQAIAFAIAVAD
jgi:phosphopantetheinyl transferase (holo-ACP synthase)